MPPGTYYHIYNHANGSENLFRKPENYRYFLQQWQKCIAPAAGTLAYGLMPDHFHFLVQIKEAAELAVFFESKKKLNKKNKYPSYYPSEGSKPSEGCLEKLISRQFSHLFNGYAQAYNRMYQRKGSLFIPNYIRNPLPPGEYPATVPACTHRNPAYPGFTRTLAGRPHSSYTVTVKDKPSFIDKKALCPRFGGRENLPAYRQQAVLNRHARERKFT